MNLNFWNIKNLEAPPRNTYKAKNQELDISSLHAILVDAFSMFRNEHALHEEAAMLSRCIYRMKLKFRSDKGLKEMEKVNRGLLQYLHMNIYQTLETFCSMVPQKYSRDTYLPTVNMLHYLMVRIQGLAQLMIRIVDSAKAAAEYMELRISIGHFWKVAFVCQGVISRIFVLTRNIARYCCKLYQGLLPFTHELKNVGTNWLPADYHLPLNLKSWLNADWLDEDVQVEQPNKTVIASIFDIVQSDSDVEFCGEYTEIQEDIEITSEYVQVKDDDEAAMIQNQEKTAGNMILPSFKVNNNEKLEIPDTVSQVMEEDIGEAISLNRNDRKNDAKKKWKRKKLDQAPIHNTSNETAKQLIDKIVTLKDLKKFEKHFCNINNQHPNVFKRLDRFQTNMLHNSLKKLLFQAKKHHSNNAKITLCLSQAKEMLKSKLL